MRRVWVCDTRTGNKLSVVPAVSFPWKSLLNGGSSNTADFKLDSEVAQGFNWRSLCEPVNRTLVIENNGAVIYAGIIWGWNFDNDSMTLSVDHSELFSILSRRWLFTSNLDSLQTQKLTMASKSLWDLARGVVEAGTSGGNFALPIFYQGTTGGTESREWYGYEMPIVASELEAIMNTEGGPDVVLDPRWSTDGSKLEWLMWDGTDPGGLLEFNLHSGRSELTGISIRHEAGDVINTLVGTGEGTERRILTALATTSANVPLVGDASFPKEKNQAVLQKRTNAHLNLVKQPTEQWSAKTRVNATQSLNLYKLGRRLRIYSRGNPIIPDGYTTLRVIQYSGGLGETINLELQKVGA